MPFAKIEHARAGGASDCWHERQSDRLNSELRHIIKKTQDSSEWIKNGLRILAERHYQDDFNFSNELTALFSR